MNLRKDIHTFTLFFIGENAFLEKEYRRENLMKSLPMLRAVLILVTLVYGIFGFLDGYMAPNVKEILWFIRFALVVLAAFFLLFLSFGNAFLSHSQVFLFVLSYLGALGILGMIILAGPSPASSSYYAGLLLIIITIHFGFPLLFHWAAFANLSIVFTYEIVSVFYGDLPVIIGLNNQFFFLSTAFICLAAGYLNEKNMRKSYLLGRLLDREREKVLDQKKKMEVLGTMSSGIAHDLNNILTSLQGYTELSLRETGRESPAYAYQEEVFRAVHRAQAMTSEILSFIRDEPAEMGPVSPAELLGNVAHYIRPLLLPGIGFSLECGTDRILWSDENQLHRILSNLCTNALHAMEEEGGRLALEAEDKGSDEICIRISDTGPGIAAYIRNKIFEPGFTTKKNSKGTGLGLFVVKQLTERLKGRLVLESEKGKGTVFSLYLPTGK